MAAWGNTREAGLDDSCPHPKGKHQHLRDRLARDPLEGGKGYHWNPPRGVHQFTWCNSCIPCGKRNGESHPIAKTYSRAGQNLSIPTLPCVYRSSQIICHFELGMTIDDTGGLRCWTTHVRDLGGVLGVIGCSHPGKWIPCPSLPGDKGDNPGSPHIAYPIKSGCWKCGAQLTVHDGREKISAHDGLGLAVGQCMGMFYMDGILIRLQDPEWLQWSLNFIIRLLQR